MRGIRLRKPNPAGMLGWVVPGVLLMGVGVLGALRGGQTGSDIAWQTDFVHAQRLALRRHRPLLVNFYTPECAWCGKMEAETFADADVVSLSRKFVCVRLDADVETALARRYDVVEYPATLFLDAQGATAGKLVGYMSPADYARAQQQVLNRLDKAQGQR